MASASIPSLHSHFNMVTPDGVSSTNEDEGNHERRSLAAAAIRRGNIKISEPILWVEGVPDASSQQHLASSIVPPDVEEEGEEDQIHGFAVSTNDDHPQEPLGDAPQLHHKTSSQYIRETDQSQARSTPIDSRLEQRDSAIEASPPGQDQMQTKKKRRSGTIRTVLRKVFGRREKNQSKQLSPPQSRAGPKHEYTLSDPLPSTTAKNPTDQSHEELRKQNPLRSQPADEYVSHPAMAPPILPFPMNVNAPEPSPSQSNYLSFETGPRVHRRRATLPSMILSPDDAAALRKMWSSPDLQPISPSAQSLGQSLPSPEIGMAYTSGSNPNRRSRSAGALRELSRAQEQTTGLRRRSSEIRYWRTSRIELLENERRVSTSSERPSQESSIAPSVHSSTIEASDAFADTGSSVHGDHVHAFDFGSITTEQNSTDKHVSVVEARLSQLEFNMQHLSLSLQEVSQQNNRHTFVLDRAPSQRRSQSSLKSSRVGLPANPKDSVFPQRTASSKRYTQSTAALTGHPAMQTASASCLPHSGPYSPLTPTMLLPGPAQIIRPTTSQATPQAQTAILEEAAPSPLIYDHLAPLYNALRYERSVRKGLETQVLQLRRDVLELGKVVTQLRDTEGYPTPSPDQTLREEGHQNERSRFSGYDSDDEGKGMAEKWATPSEETAPRPWGQVSSEGEMF